MNISKLFINLFLTLQFIIICNASAYSAAIYVNNINGIDSRTGQSSNISDSLNGPVNTITRAVQLASSGDSIFIAYTEAAYDEPGIPAGIAVINKSVSIIAEGFVTYQIIVNRVTINPDSGRSVTFSGSFKLETLLNLQSGTLNVLGNLLLGDSISISGTGKITFAGAGTQSLMVSSVGVSFTNFEINKAGASPQLKINGGNVNISSLSLTNGLVVMQGGNYIILGSYTKNASNLSHIVGNVQRYIPINSTGRFEFPVGTLDAYRLAAITFNTPIITGTTITISADSTYANSSNGFPIMVDGIMVDSTAKFCWTIKASPSVNFSQTFDLEFMGTGYIYYTSSTVQNIRVVTQLAAIYREPWVGQTGIYSNFESIPSVPIVHIIGTSGNLTTQGSIFTFAWKKACGTCGTNVIVGKVLYGNSNSKGVNSIIVTLNTNGLTSTTDATGVFRFNVVPSGSYSLTAATSNRWLGANATDAFLISAYYNGFTTFSDIQKLAGDVNGSNNINNTDALLIVRRFAGLDNSFAAGDWVFTNPSIVLSGSNVTTNISALSTGDVNGSDSSSLGTIPKSSHTVYLINNGGLKTSIKQVFSLPVKVGSAMQVGAVSLKFKYAVDFATFLGVSDPRFIANASDGTISLAWADMTGGKEPLKLNAEDILASLKFRPKDSFKSGASFSVALDADNSEFAGADGRVINNAILKVSSIEVSSPAEFSLRQNYPNPFNPSTTIEYDLPANSFVKLIIYNTLGEQVKTLVNQFQPAASYSQVWNAGNLASGVYFYKLTVEAGNQKFVQIKSVVLLK